MRIKVFTFFLLFLFVPPSSFGQAEAKAQLIDEFGDTNCDDILARVDNFFIQLHNSPGTNGVFSITGDSSELVKMLDMEQTLRTAVIQRRYNPASLTIRRGTSAKPLSVQFWLTPKNATAPVSDVNKLAAKLPRNFSPFNIRNDMSQICNPEPLEPLTSELLGDNPDGQIFVVVNYASSRERRRQLNEAVELLKTFPRSRVRYLFRKYDSGWNDYWFVSGRPTRSAFYRQLRRNRRWSY
ncbi:MAG TPA: hypothetical protein VNA17_09170 [Pyrinomonadaceae bacterium]|nr:hypothetical protein [Pyrinomonadaceae bacterium]